MINPRSMPEVTAAVRSNVTEELHELAGLTVDAVDVAVATIVQQTTTSNTRTVECAPPSPVPTAPPPLSTATRIPRRHRCNSRRAAPRPAVRALGDPARPRGPRPWGGRALKPRKRAAIAVFGGRGAWVRLGELARLVRPTARNVDGVVSAVPHPGGDPRPRHRL